MTRVGDQRPRLKLVPRASTSAGLDVVKMAQAAGLELDDWQQWVLDGALGETGDGKWSAFEAALIVPRQNGKSALLEALILAALFVWEERTVIYSAHLFATAQETFTRLRVMIEASEFADEVAKVYTANGKEAIILKNGCRVKFMARSRGGGRGFSGDRIIFDEAYDLPAKAIGAMVPTLAARSLLPDSNPQIWYASSAPHADSVVLHGLRARAQSPVPGRLFFAEWSAPSSATDDNVDAWYRANPALGIRIGEDFVRDELSALSSSPGEFSRERLGIPDALPSTQVAPTKIPEDAWADSLTGRPPTLLPGEMTMAYDVSDGWASISVAAGTLGQSYVACIEHKAGVGWLPSRVVELVTKWNPTAVGLDGGCGPAVAALGEIREALQAAELDPDIVRPLTSAEYKQACGAFFQAVVDRKVKRPRVEPDQLESAGRVAAERTIGADGAFVWNRALATVPVAPLVSATVARSLLTEVAVSSEPMFAFSK